MKKVDFYQSRKTLLTHWMVFSAIIFVTYFVQARMGKFGNSEAEVWSWLFQYLLPSISLMIGVLIISLSDPSTEQSIDVFYFRLAMGMSYFFLILIFLSSFFVPLIHLQSNLNSPVLDQTPLIKAFDNYNSVLIPVQGLSTLTLGIFFSKK